MHFLVSISSQILLFWTELFLHFLQRKQCASKFLISLNDIGVWKLLDSDLVNHLSQGSTCLGWCVCDLMSYTCRVTWSCVWNLTVYCCCTLFCVCLSLCVHGCVVILAPVVCSSCKAIAFNHNRSIREYTFSTSPASVSDLTKPREFLSMCACCMCVLYFHQGGHFCWLLFVCLIAGFLQKLVDGFKWN